MIESVLVVGGGSIGKRHLGNLHDLGVPVLGVVDPRQDRREEIAAKFPIARVHASLDEALAIGYRAAFVCSPTRFHLEAAERLVASGAHVLIEKPISDTSEGCRDLISKAAGNGLTLAVGYTYRFWPPLQKVKELLDAGRIGRPLNARIVFSEYLPDWHPWEDYRSWFMARADLGGGAMLDESHTLDIARWLFGEVSEVSCVNGRISDLEISADDLAVLLMTHESGTISTVHMDIFGRDHRKEIAIAGTHGNMDWDFYANEVRVFDAQARTREVVTHQCERNDMFLDEARAFLRAAEGGPPPPVDGGDGLATLEVALAGVQSSQQHAAVRLR